MKQAKKTLIRLSKIMLQDKTNLPNNIMDILKRDVARCLENFFNLQPKAVDIELAIDNNGKYGIKIIGKIESIKKVNTI